MSRLNGVDGGSNQGVVDGAELRLFASSASLARLFGGPGSRSIPLAIDALAAAFGTVAVLLSQSPLGMVTFVLLVATLAARRFRTERAGAPEVPRRSAYALVAAAVVGLTALVAAAPSQFWYRMFRLFEGKDLGYRPFLVRTAWGAFREHPWLGIGVGRFPENARGLAPHSTLLEAMAEGGLFHLAVPGVAVWLVTKAARRSRAEQVLPALIAVGLALIGPIDLRVMSLAAAIAAPRAPDVGGSDTPAERFRA